MEADMKAGAFVHEKMTVATIQKTGRNGKPRGNIRVAVGVSEVDGEQ
jgi:hypothetical protein